MLERTKKSSNTFNTKPEESHLSEDLQSIIDEIKSDQSPVGMDAVYVHALIVDKLMQIEQRLASGAVERVCAICFGNQ